MSVSQAPDPIADDSKALPHDPYFEDYVVGAVWRSTGMTLTESQIVDFALRYDPQRFHIDAEAAAHSHFGGLISSGWQTIAVTFRLLVQAGLLGSSAMGSPGIENLRWHRPVRPGDTVRGEAEIVDKRESGSKPDRGYLTVDFRALNQRDEVVLSYRCTEIVARRMAGTND